jgi:hypothetical protein
VSYGEMDCALHHSLIIAAPISLPSGSSMYRTAMTTFIMWQAARREAFFGIIVSPLPSCWQFTVVLEKQPPLIRHQKSTRKS